ncbi:MAG: MarR family EPS-associated transcriptional regulator [Syntrophales bacterium]
MANSWQPKLDCEETLDILREISTNPYVTQRQMSARTEISLGKVNFLIRALIEKGLVKTENFLTSEHKAAFIYRLMPAGIEERERSTVRFLRKKSEEYERLKEDIRLLEQDVAAADGLSGSRDGFQSAG